MITTTRRQLRDIGSICRHTMLGIPRNTPATVVLSTENEQLRARCQAGMTSVEYATFASTRRRQSCTMSLEAIAQIAGTKHSPVTINSKAGNTIINWSDDGLSFVSCCVSSKPDKPFPALPKTWKLMPSSLLDTLANASQCTSQETSRWALSCLRLGKEIVGTDGRQIYIHDGFSFPWRDPLCIVASGIFASPSLSRIRSVKVGKTATHVVMQSGAWTLFFEIQKEVRFPHYDGIVPTGGDIHSHIRLDRHDARFLDARLDRLPGAKNDHSPITLQLNGKVAITAGGETSATEATLSGSTYTGDPVGIGMDRRYLRRAIGMGFSEIDVFGKNSPIVCRRPGVCYAWMPLNGRNEHQIPDDVIVSRVDTKTIPA